MSVTPVWLLKYSCYPDSEQFVCMHDLGVSSVLLIPFFLVQKLPFKEYAALSLLCNNFNLQKIVKLHYI